jgi:MFS family permease
VCSALAAAAAVIVALGVVNVAADRPAPSTERRARRVLAALASDARYVHALPALVRFLAIVVIARLVVSLIDPNFARFVTEVGGDEETAGYVLAAEALMLVVFMPRWGRYSDRMGHRRTFALCAAGIAAAWMLQSVAADWLQVAGVRILNGIFLCGIVPAAFGLAARVSAVERRGSVMGVVFLCIALSHALGSMLGGGILNLFGFRTLMRLVAALLLALAGYALWDSIRSRRADRLRRLEPTKAEASV